MSEEKIGGSDSVVKYAPRPRPGALSINVPYRPLFKPYSPDPRVFGEDYPIDPGWLWKNSCGFKIISGYFMGGVMGVGMGVFMAGLGDVSPIQILHGKEVPQAPLREQFRSGYKSLYGKAGGWGRSFALMTALFEGMGCVLEKYKGRQDMWNGAITGCAVGGVMSARAGPAASCVGCAGFAAFNVIVSKIMGH